MGIHWITSETLVNEIKANPSTWLILRTPDFADVNALLAQVPPPRQRIEWICGKVVCIAALSWSAPVSGDK